MKQTERINVWVAGEQLLASTVKITVKPQAGGFLVTVSGRGSDTRSLRSEDRFLAKRELVAETVAALLGQAQGELPEDG